MELENERLKQLLEENNITVNPKDILGLKVSIVNKEGTEKIISIKDYLHIMVSICLTLKNIIHHLLMMEKLNKQW